MTNEEKYQKALALIQDGATEKDACKQVDITRGTFHYHKYTKGKRTQKKSRVAVLKSAKAVKAPKYEAIPLLGGGVTDGAISISGTPDQLARFLRGISGARE